MLPRIFDMFTQVDHRSTRSQGGLGIGLSLVKSLVEMHGGTITAGSDGPGMGSEFVVRLPALPADGEAPADAAPGNRSDDRTRAAPPHPGRGRQRRRGRQPGQAPDEALRAGGSGRPRRPRGAGRSPRNSGPRSCCWTSACRGWTATKSPGGCGVGPLSPRRCSSR